MSMIIYIKFVMQYTAGVSTTWPAGQSWPFLGYFNWPFSELKFTIEIGPFGFILYNSTCTNNHTSTVVLLLWHLLSLHRRL